MFRGAGLETAADDYISICGTEMYPIGVFLFLWDKIKNFIKVLKVKL